MEHQQPDFKELSRQLRCPSGKNSTDMAENMFQSNANMIQQTLKHLTFNNLTVDDTSKSDSSHVLGNSSHVLENSCHVLEIGFGNGKHVPDLITLANNNINCCQISYHGVDISPAMVEAAKNNNQQLLNKNESEVNFSLVDESAPLPFESNKFDRCFTVNTLYFWQNPQAYVNEIYQLLKTGGQFVICFINQDFAKKLPLDLDIFNLYTAEEVKKWLQLAGFKQVTIEGFEELTTSKFGGEVLRPCSLVIGIK